jgi:hypothetical protein
VIARLSSCVSNSNSDSVPLLVAVCRSPHSRRVLSFKKKDALTFVQTVEEKAALLEKLVASN